MTLLPVSFSVILTGRKKKKKKTHNAQCHSVRSSQTKDGLTAWWWTLMSVSGLLSWVMSWPWLLALSVRYCGQCMPVSDIAMEIQHCSTKTKLLGWAGFPWSSCQLNCEEVILQNSYTFAILFQAFLILLIAIFKKWQLESFSKIYFNTWAPL